MHLYHMTLVSGNAKTGPIPVTTSSRSTCPKACPLFGNGCYAESGPIAMHWGKVSSGERGFTLDVLCDKIKNLPRGQMWRWAQAGDLPGDGIRINRHALIKLVDANLWRRGFGFTHYPMTPGNAKLMRYANDNGFALNLSANNLEHADQLADTGAGPVVTLLPADQLKPLRTPKGRLVVVCPAYTHDIQCSRCGICTKSNRKAIVGFPAHGTRAKAALIVFVRSKPTVPQTVT